MAYYNWKFNGTLENPNINLDKGVYLLIFNGNPKRIIYTGTTNCFERRLKQHKEGYLIGNRTVWKVMNNEDIYELMSCQEAKGKAGRYKYYAQLAKKGMLWAHTTLEQNEIRNDLLKSDDFEKNWKDFVSTNFIKNIETWTCSMPDSEDRIIALESKIQRSLSKNFHIESHINGTGMNFLGKIEFTGDISEYKFEFNNFPNLDKDTLQLLKELSDEKTINYIKKSTLEKQKKEIEKIERVRKKHKFAYTSWESRENNIIYSCCKLGISKKEIAHKYLQRSVEEVVNRIKYLERFYDLSVINKKEKFT